MPKGGSIDGDEEMRVSWAGRFTCFLLRRLAVFWFWGLCFFGCGVLFWFVLVLFVVEYPDHRVSCLAKEPLQPTLSCKMAVNHKK